MDIRVYSIPPGSEPEECIYSQVYTYIEEGLSSFTKALKYSEINTGFLEKTSIGSVEGYCIDMENNLPLELDLPLDAHLKEKWKEELLGDKDEMYVLYSAAVCRCVLSEQYEYMSSIDNQSHRWFFVVMKEGVPYGGVFLFKSPLRNYVRMQGIVKYPIHFLENLLGKKSDIKLNESLIPAIKAFCIKEEWRLRVCPVERQNYILTKHYGATIVKENEEFHRDKYPSDVLLQECWKYSTQYVLC